MVKPNFLKNQKGSLFLATLALSLMTLSLLTAIVLLVDKEIEISTIARTRFFTKVQTQNQLLTFLDELQTNQSILQNRPQINTDMKSINIESILGHNINTFIIKSLDEINGTNIISSAIVRIRNPISDSSLLEWDYIESNFPSASCHLWENSPNLLATTSCKSLHPHTQNEILRGNLHIEEDVKTNSLANSNIYLIVYGDLVLSSGLTLLDSQNVNFYFIALGNISIRSLTARNSNSTLILHSVNGIIDLTNWGNDFDLCTVSTNSKPSKLRLETKSGIYLDGVNQGTSAKILGCPVLKDPTIWKVYKNIS